MIEMIFIGPDGGIVQTVEDATRFEFTEYDTSGKVVNRSMGEFVRKK